MAGIPAHNDRPSAIATADLNGFRAVRLNGSSQLVYCGSDEVPHGVLCEPPVATGFPGAFLPWPLAPQFVGIAAKAIAIGDDLYTAANGKWTDTDPGGGTIRGKALSAANGDGDQISILKVEG